MELLDIQAGLAKPEELIKEIEGTKSVDAITTYQKQYDPKKHDVHDLTKRPNKIVETDAGTTAVAVTRLSIPMQKQIVLLAAAFLCGNPIRLKALPVDQQETDFLDVLKRVWAECKLDYKSKTIAKLTMSETEAAEIWYNVPAVEGYWKGTAFDGNTKVKFRLRMKLIANKYGDRLYPLYDKTGDMIAFGRAYSEKVKGESVEHFDLYTDETTYSMVKDSSGWVVTTVKNEFGKIPVIYYSQDVPEWNDVQEMIDRLEKSLSNHGDTNDYHGDPMTLVKGEIKGYAKKGEAGRVLELANDADVKLLTWDQAPDSIKLEQMNLRSYIYDTSNTPDISFERMANLAGNLTNFGTKMMFLGAHIKASDKVETFGESMQRRINLLKRMLVNINVSFEQAEPMTIEPEFEFYLPKNYQELIDMLNTATGGKASMSQKTAVAANPLVLDPAKELELIKEDGLNEEVDPNL